MVDLEPSDWGPVPALPFCGTSLPCSRLVSLTAKVVLTPAPPLKNYRTQKGSVNHPVM